MPEPFGPRIALVDDEESILETVSFALEREGYRVATYSDGLAAWQAFAAELPDLAILDIVLPRLDGLELCRRLRQRSEALPIIFLTSKDEELDRVLGLELGADDYLCKPFSVRELAARVKVLFRRLALAAAPAGAEPGAAGPGEAAGEAYPERLKVGALTVDPARFEVLLEGRAVRLTVTELRLLEALARHPGFVKTREQLLAQAYPHDTYLAERTIDSHIKRLRRKLEEAAPGFDAIETVYGLGYRYRAEPQQP